MKKQLSNVSLVIGLLLTLIAFPASAHDGKNKLRAKMSSSQEVPLISAGGEGEFEASIDSDTSVSFKLSYEGLEGGNILVAHIHLGKRGTNGGLLTFLCNNTPVGPQPRPCPAAPATVEGTITAADIIGPVGQGVSPGQFGEFLRALRNGTAYANLHTAAFPGGEIRGQIRNDNGRHRGHDNDGGHHDDHGNHDH
ncbi:MAG: CHRD domain-containing protein [Blastocatellia bacterium]